jgi:hypothetical protein
MNINVEQSNCAFIVCLGAKELIYDNKKELN